MKQIITYISNVAKTINKFIVTIFLLVVYAIICIYHLFMKHDSKRWHAAFSRNDMEQTKHLW